MLKWHEMAIESVLTEENWLKIALIGEGVMRIDGIVTINNVRTDKIDLINDTDVWIKSSSLKAEL